MSLVILIPALDRPHRVAPLVESIAATCPDDTRAIFILDHGDKAEFEAVNEAIIAHDPLVGVMFCDGGYPRKINRGALAFRNDADLFFLGADDLEFQPGWYRSAKAPIYGETQVIGVNDLIPRTRDHQTHFLLSRDYLNRGQIDGEPGLLHEGYEHCCTDDELIAVAKYRGAYAYAEKACVKHLHPMVGEPTDHVYEKGMSSLKGDRRRFHRREKLWKRPSA